MSSTRLHNIKKAEKYSIYSAAVKMASVRMNAKHSKHSKKPQEPEWAREKLITAQFGLTHMILYNLRKEGKIRTVSLRGDGKKYGARLFHVGSVRSYLANQESKGEQS